MTRIFLLLFLVLLIPSILCADQEDLNNALILEAKAGNAEMVQYNLDQGADPNAKAQSGLNADQSVLYIASSYGHIECVKILLSAGADVNFKDPYWGETPLGVAIKKEHLEIVKILKEAGAKE